MQGNKPHLPAAVPEVHLHVAIPAMDEREWLPRTLDCIAQQRTSHPFTVYLCINQPNEWWDSADKVEICHHNADLLQWVEEYRSHASFPIENIDRSSPGNGWHGKKHGVGWARKTLFDHILSVANSHDLVISMDADTEFGPDYFESVARNLTRHPAWVALSVPYYHRLTGDEEKDRAILRYEIYMRHYALNMLTIGSPYSFTAIGSAIVVRASSLRKIGGITPVQSGEDFYLLQKLRKMGEVGSWNEECVYPAARFSDRVAFGTGPAMMKGAAGNWESYPLYSPASFQKVADTYQLIDRLYTEDIVNDFTHFLQAQFKTDDLWGPLRANARTVEQFRRSFHEKADGLRILQFLRQDYPQELKRELPETNSTSILNLLLNSTNMEQQNTMLETQHDSAIEIEETLLNCYNAPLDEWTTEDLSKLRDELFRLEMEIRRRMA